MVYLAWIRYLLEWISRRHGRPKIVDIPTYPAGMLYMLTIIIWEFFLPGLIWGRAIFCIDIGHSTLIHIVKLHLPHIYMIFVDNFKENNNPNLHYNSHEVSNTFGMIHELLKPFASNSSRPFQLLQKHFQILFLALTSEDSKSSAPCGESYNQRSQHFVSRIIMVVELSQNFFLLLKEIFADLLCFQIHSQCISFGRSKYFWFSSTTIITREKNTEDVDYDIREKERKTWNAPRSKPQKKQKESLRMRLRSSCMIPKVLETSW